MCEASVCFPAGLPAVSLHRQKTAVKNGDSNEKFVFAIDSIRMSRPELPGNENNVASFTERLSQSVMGLVGGGTAPGSTPPGQGPVAAATSAEPAVKGDEAAAPPPPTKMRGSRHRNVTAHIEPPKLPPPMFQADTSDIDLLGRCSEVAATAAEEASPSGTSSGEPAPPEDSSSLDMGGEFGDLLADASA